MHRTEGNVFRMDGISLSFLWQNGAKNAAVKIMCSVLGGSMCIYFGCTRIFILFDKTLHVAK